VQTCSVCVRKRRRLEKTFVAPKSTKWVFKKLSHKQKHTHTHTHTPISDVYTNLYTTVYIKSMYLCVHICMYVCIIMLGSFEQVLSKEPLVSVFFFFFFLKGTSRVVQLTRKNHIRGLWFKIDSAVLKQGPITSSIHTNKQKNYFV
jgi:hypothetical protein